MGKEGIRWECAWRDSDEALWYGGLSAVIHCLRGLLTDFPLLSSVGSFSLLGSVGSFSLSWVQLVSSPSLGFGRFLLPLLGSVGSFSLSWVQLVPSPSLGFGRFLLSLSWVQLQTYKLNFRFSDINISNVSFNFDYLLFDVFQRYQYQ